MKLAVLEGAVGAGKTTTAALLHKILGDRKDVLFLVEPKFTQHTIGKCTYNPLELLYGTESEKDYFAIQLVIQQKLSDYYQSVSLQNVKLIILDRWIPSCKIFLTIGYNKGLLTKFSYDVLLDNVDRLHNKFISKIKKHVGAKNFIASRDIKVYHLDVSPETCYSNIKKRGRIEEALCTENFWLEFNTKFERVAYVKSFDQHTVIGSREDIIKNILKSCEADISLNFPGIIEFEKCDPQAIFPLCSTEGSVGYDLHSTETTTIPPGGVKRVKTGVTIKHLVGNFYPQLLSRSGLALRKCTVISGTIDTDYTKEELVVILQNNDNQNPITITKNDKIAQIVFLKYCKPFSLSMKQLKCKRSGGFGSTGGTPKKKLDMKTIDEKIPIEPLDTKTNELLDTKTNEDKLPTQPTIILKNPQDCSTGCPLLMRRRQKSFLKTEDSDTEQPQKDI